MSGPPQPGAASIWSLGPWLWDYLTISATRSAMIPAAPMVPTSGRPWSSSLIMPRLNALSTAALIAAPGRPPHVVEHHRGGEYLRGGLALSVPASEGADPWMGSKYAPPSPMFPGAHAEPSDRGSSDV